MTDRAKFTEALAHLVGNQRQLDADGITVGVSREALEIVLAFIGRPLEEADKQREKLVGIWTTENSVRWKPYKPSSFQFTKGIYGRWQKAGEYGGWDNCNPPDTVRQLI